MAKNLWNYTSNKRITGTSGNDTIDNNADYVTINGGKGNDAIYSSFGNGAIIDGGADNDFIQVWNGAEVSVNGGAGDDDILINDEEEMTITGGTGNDNISLNSSSNLIQYESGDGNDTIYGFNESDTLTITGGSYSTQASGKDIIVNVGSGSIRLVGVKGKELNINKEGVTELVTLTENDDYFNSALSDVTINGLAGDDDISHWDGKNVSISGGAGNDVIENNYGKNVTLDGGKGADTIDNDGSDSTVNAGDGNDYIRSANNANNSSINGGAGNDTIENRYWANEYGGGKSVTIVGGTGNDLISLGSHYGYDFDIYGDAKNNVIQYAAGDGNDTILGFRTDSTLQISGSSYSTKKSGSDIVVTVGKGKITLKDFCVLGGDLHINDETISVEGTRTFNLTDDYDYFSNDTDSVTVNAGAGDDYISNDGKAVSINGGKGADYIYNYGDSVTINGGAGDDTIENRANKVTIIGGAGNDSIYLDNEYGANKKVLIEYSSGDGNDTISGFNKDDTLQISDGSYSTTKSGKNIVVTVGKGKITLVGAASLSAVNITEGEETETNSWKISGTTAKYGTSNKTLVTVSGVKATKGLSISGKVVTVAKSALNAKKVTISDGYTLALADDVSESTAKQTWSYSKSAATLKQTKSAGYALSNDAKSIIYSKKSTKTLTTVKGVTSKDGLSLSGTTVTVSKAALGTSKVTINNGYKLKLGKDVTEPSSKKASWDFKKSTATATYKTASTTAGYTLADNAITYSKAKSAETLATVKGVKSTNGLSVSGEKITLKDSALNKKVTVSGGYEFDFASDYKNATITGSKNSDTITTRGKKISVNGGTGDDTIKIFGAGTVQGGDGADIFYFKSSGANVISDYAEEDKISIASGAVEITTSGDDVILNGKITVEGGADKNVTYIESGVEKTLKSTPDDVIYSDDGTSATLTAKYTADNFTPNEYSKYKDTLKTIDASAVDYNLNIEGNKRANKIIGTEEDDYIDGAGGKDTILGGDGNDKIIGGDGNDSMNGGTGDDSLLGSAGNDYMHGDKGNDSLWGGEGDDTLFGGDGDDIFLYQKGDSKIVIADFDEMYDTIMVLNVKVGNYVARDTNVTFEVDNGNGQIIVQNGVNKHIELVDAQGNLVRHYSP